MVSISLFGKTKKMVVREADNLINLDNAKQTQAIIPNIIHSLDASHLMKIIKKANKDNFKPIISIHDCFGTLPSLMKQLEQRVKMEFINLYSQSQFLNNFHQRFIQNIKDNNFNFKNKEGKSFVEMENGNLLEIPKIPQTGDLNLNNIMKSKYMIS